MQTKRAVFPLGWLEDMCLALADAEPNFHSSLSEKIDPPAIRAYALRLRAARLKREAAQATSETTDDR